MTEKYISQITERLKQINPYKVILFGSYAYGKPREDSDIDLLVVTNDDFIPKNFKESTEIYLKVSEQLKEIHQDVAIDLIVHTKPMFSKFN
jgi:uncharacterized protein